MLHLGEQEAYALLASPSPEMAVFASWAMQARKGPAALEIAKAALRRLDEMDDTTLKMSLTQSILAVLSEPLREVLLAMLAANRMPKPEPWLKSSKNPGTGSVKFKVRPSWPSTFIEVSGFSVCSKVLPGTLCACNNQALTPAAVSAEPSLNFTPDRSVILRDLF